MTKTDDPLAIELFSEVFMIDQLARNRLGRVLPKGMELSQFTVLNHLANLTDPRSPAQLARTFSLTRGAITNTLQKLEWAGFIHVTPDWDDARRKLVVISNAGRAARIEAIRQMEPVLNGILEEVGTERARNLVPVLRDLRQRLDDTN